MTVVHGLTTSEGDLLFRDGNRTIGRDGVEVRAQCRHLATVLTITGDIDARTIDRLSAYATRLVPVGNALLLNMSGVSFLAEQGISILIAVDDACGSAELPWAVVTSHAVDRVLRISHGDDIFPTANSVPDAMQYFLDLARGRRHPVLARPPSARDETSMSLETPAGSR